MSNVLPAMPIKEVHRDLQNVQLVLASWLGAKIPGARDMRVANLARPTGIGVANETLFLDANWLDGQSRRAASFVARIETEDYLYPGIEFETHFKMYQALDDEPSVPTPGVIGYEGDENVLGRKFFVMQKIDGRVPPDSPTYNQAGWLVDASPAFRHELWSDAVRTMAALHGVSTSRFGFLRDPAEKGSGLERCLQYWRGYYQSAVNHEIPVMEAAWDWLSAKIPEDHPTALAWGDARFNNMLFQGPKCVGLLDWDLVSLAGPVSDLAWWIFADLCSGKGSGVTRLPGLGTGADMLTLWEDCRGTRVTNLSYHLAFAVYRMAAVFIKLGKVIKAKSGVAQEALGLDTDNPAFHVLATMLGLPMNGLPVITWDELKAYAGRA